MDARSRKVSNLVSIVSLPVELPDLKLHHGQALWLLTELGFRGATTQTTFYEYVKSLRKLGIPLVPPKLATGVEVFRRTIPITTLWNWLWRFHYACTTLSPTRC